MIKKVTLELELGMLDVIMSAVTDMPWKKANPIIHEIDGQVKKQMNEASPATDGTEPVANN